MCMYLMIIVCEGHILYQQEQASIIRLLPKKMSDNYIIFLYSYMISCHLYTSIVLSDPLLCNKVETNMAGILFFQGHD
jgi:hypothetical protein